MCGRSLPASTPTRAPAPPPAPARAGDPTRVRLLHAPSGGPPMTTTAPFIPEDADDVLVCEYERRPRSAPSFFDLHDAVQHVGREDDTLRVDFDPAVRAAVEQLAAAERQCS